MSKKKYNQGFVILYAVLVAGVISLGGVILANIITKQLILSSIGKESQIAYYAANAGDECARFGISQNQFGFFIGTDFLEPNQSERNLSCAEGSDYSSLALESNNLSKVFEFETRESSTSCSKVIVTINYLSNEGNGEGQEAIVESKGRNICDNNNHPRLLEKVIYRSGV